ncbi:MAG: hypothetical protein QGH94_03220 [Phycisphaerae bacterium]|jgi:hypothetical protein|nr:hypothetical protein [Phycisphaerae bacterium]MDP7286986.1 hypothetical protein [Phycisphaerae bacterium]
MNNPSQSKRFGAIVSAAAMFAIVFAIPLIAMGVETTTQPAASTSPGPATKPYMPDNISVAAIELTHRQKAALSAVTDGEHWNEPAFYIMLARVKELLDPETAAKEYSSLESPAVGHMTDHPSRYRAQKIRAVMWVYKSRMIVSGSEDWEARPDWPRGQKVWYMAGFHVSQDAKKGEDLVVYSLVDPTEILGNPSGTNKSGEQFYADRGRPVELAAVYYKTFKQESKGSGQSGRQIRDYPLVLAYYLKSTKAVQAPSSSDAIKNTVIGVVAVLLLLLFIVRRKAKSVRAAPIGSGGTGSVKYTPLRNVEDDDLPDEQRDDEPVNQDLIDAVKAFEEKRKTDGTDDKS